MPVAGDYDGDGKSRHRRVSSVRGGWYINYSSQGYAIGSYSVSQWGLAVATCP